MSFTRMSGRAWSPSMRATNAPTWSFRPTARPPALDVISEAVWAGSRVDIRYERGGRLTSRRLDPFGLVLKQNIWYLVARHRGSIRTYRASRITTARLRADRFDRPADFDLERFWAAAGASFDHDIRRVDTEIVIPSTSAAALRYAVPGELTRTAIDAATTDADGRLRVRLRVENIDLACDQLAGIDGVEVVTPRTLRERLHHHGLRLAAASA